jgi:hypothetical protein
MRRTFCDEVTRGIWTTWAFALALALSATAAFAQHEGKSADEVAKELSNPAGALASLVNNIEYSRYKGDLPGADDQDGWSYSFQPVLPFPVGDEGRRIIFRPLFPVPLNQPVFNNQRGLGNPIIVESGSLSTTVTPGIGKFERSDVNLGDISFDLVYAGTEMQTKHDGFLWGVGAAGTLPTATDAALGGSQWRLGPEVFGGLVRKWGTMGLLVSHQWNLAGSNDQAHSVTGGQYFYAIGLGKGWQIASGPNFAYNWLADSDQALTLPVGIGVAKTTKFGSTPVKFQVQVQYFVEQPDAFGPEWLLKFSMTPVIKNLFARN